MKYSTFTFALAFLSFSGTIAQPHGQQHHHKHQKHHEKRDVVWTTTWEVVTETLSITTTIWVDGDATSTPQTSSTSPVLRTSTSTTQTPAEFHQSLTTSSSVPATSVSVAPYTPPTPSTSSPVSAPPAPATSSHVAAADPATIPVYVAPTTSQAPYVAPDPTTSPPAVATTAPASSSSSSGSGGVCSSGNPCTGDITYYQAGLGACGITNDGDAESVIALPHELMGTQSNGNPYCGKTVTITKDGTSVMAKVVDKCMGCNGTSIDLSNKAFSGLGLAFAVGRTQATWYFND